MIYPKLTLLLTLLVFLGYDGSCQSGRHKKDLFAPVVVDSSVLTNFDELSASAPEGFHLRTLPDTLVRRWRRDPDLAYANDPDYWKKKPPEKEQDSPFLLWLVRILNSKAFRVTLYIVLGLLLVYAIVRIMLENNVRLFYKSPKKGKRPAGPELPADELGEDLNERLQYFIQRQDYRQATRYLYLISLTLLQEKGMIRWHPRTTNQEYLLQLKGSAFESSFRYLTGIYERVWYGEFPLIESQFNRLNGYFADFFKSIPA